MTGRSKWRSSGAAVGCAAVALGGIGVAQAQKGGEIRPELNREARKEAKKLSDAIADPKVARSAAFSAKPPYGPVAGVSTKRLAGFPLQGKSFLILSTGNVLRADDKNSSGKSGQNAGGPGIRGARDVTMFRINLRVPEGRNCLRVRFRFLTEEFPEFVNDEFNDAFIMELEETTCEARPLGGPRIEAPDNFATDSAGGLISVNSTGDTTLTKANAKGTTYDGATRRLRASTRITPGRHRLYMSIFDQGDRQFDSTVFVDRLTVVKSASCESGTVKDD